MDNTQDKVVQRYSRQREEILRIVLETRTHPTADWVYDQVRQTIPNISLGTVYRNLNLLADEGKIRQLILDDGVVRFDGNKSEHHHFICTKSGKILDIEEKIGDNILHEFNSKTGLKAKSFKIEFFGETE